MKRFLSPLTAAGFCAALAVAGCDSGNGTTGSGTTTPDATSGGTDATVSDTPAPGGDATTGETKDTVTGGTDATTPDVPKTCEPTCKPDEDCKDGKCVPKPVTGCNPACKPGTEYCDLMTKPPVCKAQTCKFPDKWGTDIQKVSVLKVAVEKDGCDLDADGKPNNVLGKTVMTLYPKANDAIIEQIQKGTLVILFEPSKYATDGTKFDMNLLIGDQDAADATCDTTKAGCKYTVKPDSYDPAGTTATCPARVAFPEVTVKGDALTAGGKNQVFDLALPVMDIPLKIKISQAQVSGKTTSATKWETTTEGKICGVIGKKDLDAAIDQVPEELVASIGSKEQLKTLLSGLLKADIDTDGKGECAKGDSKGEECAKDADCGGEKCDTFDAISIAVTFETVGGTITGLTPPKK